MKYFLEFIQKLMSSTHHYQSIHQDQGSSFYSFWDILLTREKCPNLQKTITHEIFLELFKS